MNTWGNRAAHLPLRMTDAKRSGYQGTVVHRAHRPLLGERAGARARRRTVAVGVPQYVAHAAAAERAPADELLAAPPHRRTLRGRRARRAVRHRGRPRRLRVLRDPRAAATSVRASCPAATTVTACRSSAPFEPRCPIRTARATRGRSRIRSTRLDLNPVLFGVDRIPIRPTTRAIRIRRWDRASCRSGPRRRSTHAPSGNPARRARHLLPEPGAAARRSATTCSTTSTRTSGRRSWSGTAAPASRTSTS